MFSLHETTRKRICRAAFFLLCVAPTIGTLVWAGYALRPHREREWEEKLGRRLDVRAELTGAKRPRPGAMRFASVKLNDADRGVSLLELRSVRTRTDGAALGVAAKSALLLEESASKWARLLAKWVAAEPLPIDVRIERFEIVHRSMDQSIGRESGPTTTVLALSDVVGRLDTALVADRGAVRRLQLRGKLDNPPGGEHVVRATLERWTRDGQPMLRAKIDLGEAFVPASLLRLAFPGAERLLGSRWTGTLQLNSSGADVDGALHGRFIDVSLAQLLPRASPHRLLGTAAIQFERLVWSNDRIERMEGGLRTSSGSASRSLLIAANEKLFCVDNRLTPASSPTGNTTTKGSTDFAAAESTASISFDEAALRFEVDVQGLTIWGACPPAPTIPAGALATLQGRPLLVQPQYTQLPMGAWLQFLLAPAPSWLPATREAVETARRLPLSTDSSSRQ